MRKFSNMITKIVVNKAKRYSDAPAFTQKLICFLGHCHKSLQHATFYIFFSIFIRKNLGDDAAETRGIVSFESHLLWLKIVKSLVG